VAVVVVVAVIGVHAVVVMILVESTHYQISYRSRNKVVVRILVRLAISDIVIIVVGTLSAIVTVGV